MVLPIVQYNAPVLRERGAVITSFDDALAALARDMVETMHAAGGIGLAAQQIGRPVQLCVIDLTPAVQRDFSWELDGARPPLELIMPMTVVNPSFEALPRDTELYEEGCLSFPEIRGDVERPALIRAQFQDVGGIPHTMTCDGLLARCIQHEIDHLNGVLFIDRMKKKARQAIDRDLKELARRNRSPATA